MCRPIRWFGSMALIASVACQPSRVVDAPHKPPIDTSSTQPFPSYEMIDLGSLGSPVGIDSLGRVYADISDSAGHRMRRWDRGTITEVVIPSGFYALSRNGLFGAGSVCPHASGTCTLFFLHDGTVAPLETGDPVYAEESVIRFVGDDGTVIGAVQETSQAKSQTGTAVLWRHGARHDLEAIDSLHPLIAARMINARGQVIGVSYDAQFRHSVPYLWQDGVARDLGSLFDQSCAAQPDASCGGTASWINGPGDIVGWSVSPTGLERAVIWRGGGAVQDLGLFPGQSTSAEYIDDQGDIWGFGGPNRWWAIVGGVQYDPGAPAGVPSQPARMNQRGDVVGYVGESGADSHGHAFVWRKGTMLDLGLGPAGSQRSSALYINDRGDVVGAYVNAQGQPGIVLWRVSN